MCICVYKHRCVQAHSGYWEGRAGLWNFTWAVPIPSLQEPPSAWSSGPACTCLSSSQRSSPPCTPWWVAFTLWPTRMSFSSFAFSWDWWVAPFTDFLLPFILPPASLHPSFHPSSLPSSFISPFVRADMVFHTNSAKTNRRPTSPSWLTHSKSYRIGNFAFLCVLLGWKTLITLWDFDRKVPSVNS